MQLVGRSKEKGIKASTINLVNVTCINDDTVDYPTLGIELFRQGRIDFLGTDRTGQYCQKQQDNRASHKHRKSILDTTKLVPVLTEQSPVVNYQLLISSTGTAGSSLKQTIPKTDTIMKPNDLQELTEWQGRKSGIF